MRERRRHPATPSPPRTHSSCEGRAGGLGRGWEAVSKEDPWQPRRVEDSGVVKKNKEVRRRRNKGRRGVT